MRQLKQIDELHHLIILVREIADDIVEVCVRDEIDVVIPALRIVMHLDDDDELDETDVHIMIIDEVDELEYVDIEDDEVDDGIDIDVIDDEQLDVMQIIIDDEEVDDDFADVNELLLYVIILIELIDLVVQLDEQ